MNGVDAAATNVAAHYDAVITRTEAERAAGDLYKLKRVHNDFKRALLRRFSGGPGSTLLDIGCGRGGDLRKWDGLRAHGVDISVNEIAEAMRRCAELGLAHTFQVLDIRDAVPAAATYDAVSAMFCMHYFFESEDVLRRVLGFVAGSLRKGGKFFGCCPDADRVRAFAGSPYAVVERRDDDVSYIFRLVDSVMERAEIVEYYVDMSMFRRVAATCGLELIYSAPFEPPPGSAYPGIEVTRLFRSFAFVKIREAIPSNR